MANYLVMRKKEEKPSMMKANKGMSVKGDDKRDIRKTESMIGAKRSSKREKDYESISRCSLS